ncbi:MAG: BrnT family toxin, partial [Microvirga sp.]
AGGRGPRLGIDVKDCFSSCSKKIHLDNYLDNPHLHSMEFGWDPVKGETNLAKHGIDFAGVGSCFVDPDRRVWQDARREYGEARFNMLARRGSRVLHVTFTVRGQVIWLISARKANPREQRKYAREREH